MSETTEYYCPWCSPGCPENEIQNISSETPPRERRCIICGSELKLAIPPKKSISFLKIIKKNALLIFKIIIMLIINIAMVWKLYREYLGIQDFLNIDNNLKAITSSYDIVIVGIVMLCIDVAFAFNLLNGDLKQKIFLKLKKFKIDETKILSATIYALIFVILTLVALEILYYYQFDVSFLNK